MPLQYSADANNATRNYRCLLTVNETPSFTDSGMGTAVAGTKLASPLGASGTTGYPRSLSLDESGPLPSGLLTRTMPGRNNFHEEFVGKLASGTAGDYLLNITANNGDGDPVTEGYVLVVTSPAQTQGPTSLSLSGPTTTTYGTGATYVATVNGGSSPTGFVEFDVSGANAPITVPLSGGQASFTTPASIDVNNYTITATYTGDPGNGSSTSSTDLTVEPIATDLMMAGAASTPFGTPITYTATVTSAIGAPQGAIDFKLDGNDNYVDVDTSGTATFTTDPTLSGLSSPHEVDAAFSSYSDAPGDWATSNTVVADYTIGPTNITAAIGDGSPADANMPVVSGDVVNVNPADETEISAQLFSSLTGMTVSPQDVSIDVLGSSDETTKLGLSDLSGPASDPETGTTDYFWVIGPGSLSALSETSAVVSISFAGTDQYASTNVQFTLQW